ncbi:hypothetical protein DOJK_01127 [Patescibacteria group bacterium]|nr:hypothetical protein DOJK_01127 [Patescibacteria group bacterium]
MTDTIHYIKRVEIQGLWQKFDLVWDLNPDVNILAGVNGSGKTTVLNSIYDLLFYKMLATGSKIQTIELIDSEHQSILYNKHEYDNKGSYGISTFDINTEPLKINKVSNFETKINKVSNFETELKDSESIKKLSNENVKTNLDWQIYHLQKEYLDYQLTISKRKDQIIENSDNVKSEIEKINYPKTRFLQILDDLFAETGKKVDRDKNEINFLLDEQAISAFQLSSGEKQLLIILLTVLVQDNKPSILFMDEPEISLHIDWQRKLIQYIRELNPNVQIILATHSPDIIMEGWLDKVFEISDLNKEAV